MSIHDARVLAEVLLADHRDVVGEYERRRRPANERSLGFTRGAVRFFRLRARAGFRAWLAGRLAVLVRQPWFASLLLRRAARSFLGD
jgi:2-polyprenyl-6-methoxyphenol hydroxylase-like FAD-dependent oxidoreductase